MKKWVDMAWSGGDIMRVLTTKGGCMDEMSWRARLAKSNINILNVDRERWYYEFMYHPKPGQTKWCKTFYELPEGEIKIINGDHTKWYREPVDNNPETIAEGLRREVLRLRKELEN